MKVCPSTYPSDAVLSFCGQVFDDAKIFCFLSFMLVILIYFSLYQGSALPTLRSLVVLWLLLTSHGKLYSVLHTLFPHVHETSRDRKSTRLNSSHVRTSYAVFCLKKKNQKLSYSLRILTIEFSNMDSISL